MFQRIAKAIVAFLSPTQEGYATHIYNERSRTDNSVYLSTALDKATSAVLLAVKNIYTEVRKITETELWFPLTSIQINNDIVYASTQGNVMFVRENGNPTSTYAKCFPYMLLYCVTEKTWVLPDKVINQINLNYAA
jgi:hypothetical protein